MFNVKTRKSGAVAMLVGVLEALVLVVLVVLQQYFANDKTIQDDSGNQQLSRIRGWESVACESLFEGS